MRHLDDRERPTWWRTWVGEHTRRPAPTCTVTDDAGVMPTRSLWLVRCLDLVAGGLAAQMPADGCVLYVAFGPAGEILPQCFTLRVEGIAVDAGVFVRPQIKLDRSGKWRYMPAFAVNYGNN